jgi:heavy metal translocating P-type ATPase
MFSLRSPNTLIALLAALGIALHLLIAAPWPLYVVLGLGGAPLLWELLKKLFALDFGSDLLAGMSILTAIALEQYLVGSIVVLMLSGGAALEDYAMQRASAVLSALAKRMPRIAHRRKGTEVADISLDQVAVGDVLTVLPHETCPVDGTVIAGRGTMDESFLTGEPFRIAKLPGAAVISGAINGDAVLEIEATKLPVDSRYAQIMRVMQQAEESRPAMRRIADRLGSWYTPLALAVAGLGWGLSGDPSRFLGVLVIATPCPLLIAIPVAILGAISLAARRAIIIKDPAMLERIDTCRTFIFDKTGTLTYGRPALTDILTAPGRDRRQVLSWAASLEQFSKHPLAGAVIAAAEAEGVPLEATADVSEKPGQGLVGHIGPLLLQITARNKVTCTDLPPVAPGMECILLVDGQYVAALRFHDAPRKESHPFIEHLKPRHGVAKVMLLSGDREAEVRYLAAQVGITEVLYSKSPEEKVAIVRQETLAAPTLFVGDGINDAPAMQAATVGIAFGQNSDVTAEAADAVILEASLQKVDELIHIGRRLRRIALECAVGGMALSLIGMVAAATGYLPPVAGAIAQEVIDLVAVLNALRMALPTDDLSDMQSS